MSRLATGLGLSLAAAATLGIAYQTAQPTTEHHHLSDVRVLSSETSPVTPALTQRWESVGSVDGRPTFRHATGWDIAYDDDGISCADEGFQLSVRAQAVGRMGERTPLVSRGVQTFDTVIEYQYDGAVEWFDRNERGLHHGITFSKRPQGEGPLTLDLGVKTDLKAEVFAEDLSLLYTNDAGEPVMAYDGLLVVDATGKTLPSTMTPSQAGIRITVDDAAAIYPLTIDPVFERVTPGAISLFVDRAEALPSGGWRIWYGYSHYNVNADVSTVIPLGPDNRFTSTPVAGLIEPPTEFLAGRHVLPPLDLAKKQSTTWTVTYEKADGGSSTKTSAAGNYRRKISPIVENGGSSLFLAGPPEGRRTEWGYFNRMPFPLTIPFGRKNKFRGLTPDPAVVPQTFLPGRHVKVFSTDWAVEGPDAKTRIVWTIDRKTATAGANKVINPPQPNRPPVIGLTDFRVPIGGRVSGDVSISDPDGDLVNSWVVLDLGAIPNFRFDYSAGRYRISTSPSYTGYSVFGTIHAEDEHGLKTTARFEVIVDKPPRLFPRTWETDVGTPVTVFIPVDDSDRDGISFDTMNIVTPPANGTLVSVRGAAFTYTPNPGFEGIDTFEIEGVEDGLSSGPVLYQIEVVLMPPEAMALISRTGEGLEADGNAYSHDISGDGRYVVFSDNAPDLMVTPTFPGSTQVYRFDRLTEEMAVVSNPTLAEQNSTASLSPRISADGRYVVYASQSTSLTPNSDTNGTYDVFLWDAQDNSTTLLSKNSTGSAGNGHSSSPTISGDGSTVVFTTFASDVGTGPRGQGQNLIRYDVVKGATTVVTPTSAIGPYRFALFLNPDLDFNGSAMVFSTHQALVAPDTAHGSFDVYKADIDGQNVQLISINQDGSAAADGKSERARISGDGQSVVFASEATDLLATAQLNDSNIYHVDLSTGDMSLVDTRLGTTRRDADSRGPSIDYDGDTVAFISDASDLMVGDSNARSAAFVWEKDLGEVRIISRNADGDVADRNAGGVTSLTDDGLIAVFFGNATNFISGRTAINSMWQTYVAGTGVSPSAAQ